MEEHDAETINLFRDLFLEVAIIEHLVRSRADKIEGMQMTTGQFGVLNYFVRQGLKSDSEETIAWAFQDDAETMARKIDALVERGFLLSTGETPNRKLAITDTGNTARSEAFNAVQQEIAPLTEGIDLDEARTALNVLRELRRTMDNLPDR